MSKTSWFLVALMGTALVCMGAVRWQEWQTARRALEQQTEQAQAQPFSFQDRSVSLAAPQGNATAMPVRYEPQYPPIYIEDVPLDADTQLQQAQETLFSIVQDFQDEPALQDFNRQLQQVSSGTVNGLVDLSSQNLSQILQQNPQIQQVVQQHLKRKDFAQVVEQIFSNPQFQQSVRQLQQKPQP